MLTVSDLSKSFSGRVLFEKARLQVNRGERIGLVGANGVGKSTLFSLILGEASPDEGRVALEKGATIGFLPQESAAADERTVLELATNKAVPATSQTPESVANYQQSRAPHDFVDSADGEEWQLEAKAKRILHGLAFRESDFHRPLRALSGGWIMRAHLARLLVQEPDLLLLDEPTNHLDLESVVWFREYLRNYPGAIVMISHDRAFLNTLVEAIVEIAQQRLHRYRGNWDSYEEQKRAREEQHVAAYQNQQREIASLQRFADRFRAKASKASQAQSKLKQIDRMEKIEAPVQTQRSVKFRFPQPARSGQRVITLKDVDHDYGKVVVYRRLNFAAERGDRTVLVGPNGAGKSTLLKLLAGTIPVQCGARELGYNVNVGYYSQHRVEMLDLRQTVLEAALDAPDPVSEQVARTVLGSFLFRGDDVFKPVAVLSGGEKSRLALVKLLLDPPNLLLMDEPTTHLDIASIDALIAALKQFEGTILFISHDIHFIRSIATTVVHVNAGRLTRYAGDYDYYVEKSAAESAQREMAAPQLSNAQPANAAAAASPAPREGLREQKERKRIEAEQRKAASRDRREKERIVSELEMRIVALEGRQGELAAALEDPAAYEKGGSAMELNRELLAVAEELARWTAEWENAARALVETNAGASDGTPAEI
jgi:ATP-binding cassette subfamily F protein 3